MRGSRVLRVACLLALATPLRAQGPVIDHSAAACMAAERFPQVEARITEPDAISRARVQFRGEGGPWYFVEMKRAGEVFTGILPKPKKSLKTIHYYIEATDRQFRENRTQEFAASVVPQATVCADGKKMMAGVASTASVIVGSPAGAAAVPAGFSPAGVASATGSSAGAAGISAGSGGGIGTAATVGIIAGGAAIAGVAVAATSGGDASPTTTVPVAASYTGPFAGQRTTTGISQLPGCESVTATFIGAIRLTLQASSGATITGTSNTTGGTTVIANTGNCQGEGNKVGDTTQIGWEAPVTGTAGSLAFRAAGDGRTGTIEAIEFSGALSGGVVSGTVTFSISGLGRSGTVSIPVMLR